MKILQLHNYYQYRGGEDTYFDSLSELLSANGHQVTKFTKDSKDILNSFRGQFNSALGMFWNKSIEQELETLIHLTKPDIAHFHNINPLVTNTAYFVCKKFKIPIVQSIHNYRFLCPKGTLFRNGNICKLCVTKRFKHPSILYSCYHNSFPASVVYASTFFLNTLNNSFNLIDIFIFPSLFSKSYFSSYTDFSDKKKVMIPYFVPDYKIKKINLLNKDYFIFVGRLSEEKGIIQLLEIFKNLSQFNLIVIGDGQLKDQVSRYKKFSNIKVLSYCKREEVLQYMGNALCTIIPSRWFETGPIVMFESLCKGTPIIIPDIGSFNEVASSKDFGYQYNHKDFLSLKNKIELMWKNRKIWSQKKEEIKSNFYKKYSSEKHYELLLNNYSRLLNRKI